MESLVSILCDGLGATIPFQAVLKLRSRGLDEYTASTVSACCSHTVNGDTLFCLSVCLSICLSVCLPACLSVCLPVCLSVCLPVCLSDCLSVYLSVCLSDCLSVWLPVCLTVCLSVCRPNVILFGWQDVKIQFHLSRARSLSLPLSPHLSLCVCLAVCLSACLTVSLPLSVSFVFVCYCLSL